ncbi:hypothetical protein MPDQ_001872 [Monascus purpureus]|uniref:Zn(2)-C6 fungal-type domain-containing protein n=1 Tax=Monascus purpureus TaxID=5098 RepID=A0A507QLQ6_MONPU|nr:hypothetical protein MPDQ_001872 [Monascus purpureus]BDD62354.1 hypothetical protein MAP00_007323 [Monascus purpureus]
MTDSVGPNKIMDTAKGTGPSLLACLICRQKHLKCDGITPVCGRCAASGANCQYTPSRRGYKGQSKKRRANPPSPEEQLAGDPDFNGSQISSSLDVPIDWSYPSRPGYDYPAPAVYLPSSSTASSSLTVSGNNVNNNIPQTAQSARLSSGPPTPDSSPATGGDGYLIDVYYNFFHPAHPILPPLRFLYRSLVPLYLDRVIKFIGSHFTNAISSDVYRPTVMSSVIDQEGTVEKVQALILLAVVLHSRNERMEAGECLSRAVDLAFQLGLHREDFAVTMGGGDPVREESLRRTWWELFMVEGMLTALGVRQSFSTSLVPLDVPLPCEERIYQDGLTPPRPLTVAQFDERVFADEELDFSSHSYRIEAVRILGRVVAVQDMEQGQQDQVEAIDARISSWFHHLPESKSELMRPDGSIDEMMFQATMIVNGASIYLHFPRSDLLSSPAVAAEVICGHHSQYSVPAFSSHAHAMKAVKAASELSSLAAIRLPVVKHTPFFICALVLSSIVQLAACSVKAGRMPDPSRDRLTLTIGVFRSLGRTWAISQAIMRQVKAVARDVMDMGLRPAMDQLDMASLLQSSRYWFQDTADS